MRVASVAITGRRRVVGHGIGGTYSVRVPARVRRAPVQLGAVRRPPSADSGCSESPAAKFTTWPDDARDLHERAEAAARQHDQIAGVKVVGAAVGDVGAVAVTSRRRRAVPHASCCVPLAASARQR